MTKRNELRTIMNRIESAGEDSQIVVFRTMWPGIYRAMFANTVLNKEKINDEDPQIIGVYFGRDGVAAFAKQIGAVHD